MRCCGRNNGKYYSRANTCCEYEDVCCDNDNNSNVDDLTGVSCPFTNNNCDCCAESLREAACRLTNQRVIIHVDGCKMCVVIVGIGDCFLKTVNPCTQKIVYFNLNRIDNIEDVLPRCY